MTGLEPPIRAELQFTTRAGVAAGSLAILGAFVVAVATDQPPVLRLPLTLVVLLVVPGLALVNLYPWEPSAATVTLVLGVSLAVSSLIGGALASLGHLRPLTTAVALALVSAPLFAVQLRRLP